MATRTDLDAVIVALERGHDAFGPLAAVYAATDPRCATEAHVAALLEACFGCLSRTDEAGRRAALTLCLALRDALTDRT